MDWVKVEGGCNWQELQQNLELYDQLNPLGMKNSLLMYMFVNYTYNMALWWFDIFMGWEV